MKFHFCIILVLVFVKTTNAQLPVSADSIFNYIQSNSVYTAANWSEIKLNLNKNYPLHLMILILFRHW